MDFCSRLKVTVYFLTTNLEENLLLRSNRLKALLKYLSNVKYNTVKQNKEKKGNGIPINTDSLPQHSSLNINMISRENIILS